jgi:hypothetical protein
VSVCVCVCLCVCGVFLSFFLSEASYFFVLALDSLWSLHHHSQLFRMSLLSLRMPLPSVSRGSYLLELLKPCCVAPVWPCSFTSISLARPTPRMPT